MNKKILILIMAIICVSPMLSFASENKGVASLIDAFGDAITAKDKTKFLSLFVEENVSWIGVFSEKEFNKFQDVKGAPGKLYHSNPNDFIDWVIKLDGKPKEEFRNIVIKTDGEVASVYFDYKFYLDSKIQNWGAESWLVVKSENGWKIQAVNFSYTSNK